MAATWVAAAVNFVYPIADAAKISTAQLEASLRASWPYLAFTLGIDWPLVEHYLLQRPTFPLAVFLTALLVGLAKVRNPNGKPLTIPSTDIRLSYEDPQGQRVLQTCVQFARANRPDIKAIRGSVGCDVANGLEDNSIVRRATRKGYSPKDRTDCVSDGHNGWELIHHVEPALPYSPFYLLLPKAWKTKCVELYEEVVYTGAFLNEQEHFDYTVFNHISSRLSISISFPEARHPNRWRLLRVYKDNVENAKLKPSRQGGRFSLTTELEDLRLEERILLMWRFPAYAEAPGEAEAGWQQLTS